MRTTIRMDDELFAKAKQHALETGQTFTAVIEAAVQELLARRNRPARRRRRVRLPTSGGNGLLPGVDLNNSGALLDLMEGR